MSERCVICQERVDVRRDEAAEMHDPSNPIVGGVVHAECGIAEGWEVS